MQQLFYQNEQDRLASDGPEDAEFGYGQIGELTQQLPYHDSSTFQASQALPPQSPQEAALLQQGLPPIEATRQAYFLQKAKQGSQDPTGPLGGTSAANPVSTAAVEPKKEPEPSARALPSAPVTVPRRPPAPRPRSY